MTLDDTPLEKKFIITPAYTLTFEELRERGTKGETFSTIEGCLICGRDARWTWGGRRGQLRGERIRRPQRDAHGPGQEIVLARRVASDTARSIRGRVSSDSRHFSSIYAAG